MQLTSITKGVSFTAIAYFCFSVSTALGKVLSSTLSSQAITFWQFFIMFLGTLVVIVLKQDENHLKVHHPTPLIIRAVTGVIAYALFYHSVRYIPMVDSVLLNSAFPLYVPIIAYFWGHGYFNPKLWIGIIIGFFGVLVVLRPNPETFHMAAVWGLLGGILSGVSLVAMRRSIQVESPIAVVFYYALSGVLVFAFWGIQDLPTGSWALWAQLISVGLGTLSMQYFTVKALQYAPTSVVAPFAYSSIIFSGLFAWIFWGHTPDLWTVVGSVLIVGGATTVVKMTEV